MKQIKLDEKTRRELYKLLPFSMSARVDYTPETLDFLGEDAPVFKIRQMTKEEYTETRRNAVSKSLKDDDLYTISRKLIYGWKKYREILSIDSDENGSSIKYGEDIKFTADENGNPTEECIKKINPWVLNNILQESFEISTLQDIERASLT